MGEIEEKCAYPHTRYKDSLHNKIIFQGTNHCHTPFPSKPSKALLLEQVEMGGAHGLGKGIRLSTQFVIIQRLLSNP